MKESTKSYITEAFEKMDIEKMGRTYHRPLETEEEKAERQKREFEEDQERERAYQEKLEIESRQEEEIEYRKEQEEDDDFDPYISLRDYEDDDLW